MIPLDAGLHQLAGGVADELPGQVVEVRLQDPDPVGVGTLEGQFVTNWGVIAAGSLMTMVPITIVFLIFQRWFVRASLAGALKG